MHTHQKDPSEPLSSVKCRSALLSFKQAKVVFALTNTKHTGLLDVQNGCPGRWESTEHNVCLGRTDTEKQKHQEKFTGRWEKQ